LPCFPFVFWSIDDHNIGFHFCLSFEGKNTLNVSIN
jgi:hypothetical protein